MLKRPSLRVSDTTPGAGDPFLVKGTGCKPNDRAHLYLDSHWSLGYPPTDGEGDFAKLATINKLGKHSITATCHGLKLGPVKIHAHGPYGDSRARTSTVAVSTSTVAAGKTLAISAPRCDNGTADAALNNTQLVLAAPVRQGGLYNAKTTIPTGTRAGTYQLAARCNGRVDGVATVRVVAAGQLLPAGTTGLPTRQVNILPGLGAGLALIVTGGVVLASIKRRRSRRVA